MDQTSLALSPPVTSYSAPVTIASAPAVALKVGWLKPDYVSPAAVFLASDAKAEAIRADIREIAALRASSSQWHAGRAVAAWAVRG